jgi:cytochrome P450
MPRFARDILQAVVDGWHECGDLVRFRGLRTMTLAAHPDYVQHVMEERQEIYPRSDVVKDYLSALMGQGLFIAEGDRWRRQRALLDPVFSSDHVKSYEQAIVSATDAMLSRWSGTESVDVYDEMRDLSLAIMERALFGRELEENGKQFRADVITAVEYISPRVMAPVNPPEFLPPGRRAKAAIRRINDVVSGEIASRAGDSGKGDDLLAAMMASRGAETRERMSAEQTRDEVLTAIFGAYKGLPGGLTWLWYLLAQHPDVRERVQGEIDAAVGAGKPTAEDVPRLDYLRATIDEALRLYPPLWIWSRPPTEPDEIAGYQIPKGMFVLCIPYVTHRHSGFWSEPEVFDPDRFRSPGVPGGHPHAYFPFASGPRRCIGEAFSRLAMALVVADVLQSYRLQLEPGYTVKRALEFFLRPANGMRMKVEPVAERVPAPN